jgi:hypothetical protein
MVAVHRALSSLQKAGYARAERQGGATWWYATASGRRFVAGWNAAAEARERDEQAARTMAINRRATCLYTWREPVTSVTSLNSLMFFEFANRNMSGGCYGSKFAEVIDLVRL